MEQLLEKYYYATNRDKRKGVLDKMAKHPDCEVLHQIWTLRYESRSMFGQRVEDSFLNAMMEMLYIASQKISFLNAKRLKKQVLAVAQGLRLDEYAQLDPSEQKYYYREYENVMNLFMELGESDSTYSRGAFNILELSSKKLKQKLWVDLSRITQIVPETFQLSELFAPFAEAAETAFQKRYTVTEEDT